MTANTVDRRLSDEEVKSRLRGLLNAEQRHTLSELERFGWELKFVRRPLFQPSIPVIFDGDRKAYAMLEPDGTLSQDPGFDIRGN